jgi:phosphoglycerate dehydrogenase-like enzyme
VDAVVDLVSDADHVVICAALTRATRGAFDTDVFAHMKPGAHLVNVARGAIVDTDALLVGLDAGRPGHASLDVTDPEPLPDGHPLRCHSRATVTPHISGLVAEAEHRNWNVFVDNVQRRLRGEPLSGIVDADAGY